MINEVVGTLLLLKESSGTFSKDTPSAGVGHPSVAADFTAAEKALALEPVEGDAASFGGAFASKPGCPHPAKVRPAALIRPR